MKDMGAGKIGCCCESILRGRSVRADPTFCAAVSASASSDANGP